jgi:hypothetical protein
MKELTLSGVLDPDDRLASGSWMNALWLTP